MGFGRRNASQETQDQDTQDSAQGASGYSQAMGNSAQAAMMPGVVPTGPVATGLFGWAADRIGDALNIRPDEARRDAEEELADFMGQSYSKDDHQPSTGRGLFDADYDPSAGELRITCRVHFTFRNGDPTDPDWTAKTAGGTFDAADFEWQDDEKTGFADNTLAAIEAVWSEQYSFHSTRPHWGSLPTVKVVVDIQQVDQADAHYDIEVFKWPSDVLGAHVDIPAAGATQSGGEWNESVDDAGIEGPDTSNFRRTPDHRTAYKDADNNNPGRILFGMGSSEVGATDRAALQTFGQTLGRAAMPAFPVSITGHASTEGGDEANMRLSEDRAREVNNIVVGAGAKTQPTVRGRGETGMDATPESRRVDITVGDFRANQRTVVHEAGHMLGLGDEYPRADDGGSRQVGDEVAHSDLAESWNLTDDPVVAHHSDSIMSNGETVEPYHYATFIEVLAEITGTQDWAIGPAVMGPGDFPAPGGGGTAFA